MAIKALPHLNYLNLLATQSLEDLLHRFRLHLLLHCANSQSYYVLLAACLSFLFITFLLGIPSLLSVGALFFEAR